MQASHPVGEETGLVCGFLFKPGEPAEEISTPQWPREDGRFAWLHFNLAHLGARRWLERQDGLSTAFREALNERGRATRLERGADALVAVLNDVHFDFRFEPSEIATLWISVDRRLIVTARQSPLRSVDRLRRAIKAGEPLASTVELLERLLRAQADVLIDIVRHVTREVDGIEDALLAGRLQVKRATLGAQRRLLVRLQRLLAPEPASLFRLLQQPPAWLAPHEVRQLMEASEEFSVALRDMSSLQERIKLLQEELSAHLSERTSRSLFLLTIATVIALPINILAGLFGMNVGGVPLAGEPYGFWVLAAVVLVFTGCAAWLAFRRVRDD